MAVTFVAASTPGSNTHVSSPASPQTFLNVINISQANTIVLLGVEIRGTGTSQADISAVTLGGASVIKLGGRNLNDGTVGGIWFGYVTGLSTGVKNVAVTFSSSPTTMLVGVVVLAGHEPATPVRTTVSAAGAGAPATPTVNVTDSQPGDMIIDLMGIAHGTAMTANNTEQWEDVFFPCHAGQQTAPGASGTVTMSWTSADGDWWAILAVAVKAAGGGGGGGGSVGVVVQNRTIFIDGEPFFPLGFYHVTQFGTRQDLLNSINRTAAGGANIIHCGHFNPNDLTYGDVLDQCHALGLKVITEQGSPPSTATLTAMIANFASKPAVLGWNLADDVDNGGKTPAQIQTLFNIVNTNDPTHIAYVTGFRAPNEPGPGGVTIADFYGVSDLVAMQRYPVEYALPFQGIDLVYSVDKTTVDGSGPNNCIIANNQTKNHRDERGNRFPTPAEGRNMAYCSLAAGVKGIIWYPFFDGANILDVQAPALWSEMQTTIAEIKVLAPTLLGGTMTQAVTDVANDRVASHWVYQGSVKVVVINSSLTTAKSFSIPMPAGTTGPLVNVFPSRPSGMTFSNGTLSGTVAATDVHVYSLSLAGSFSVGPSAGSGVLSGVTASPVRGTILTPGRNKG